MSALLTIGEFSRLSHLSVKALRHYDEVGLLRPASVDPSGYRRYASAQVPIAQVIRRFRDLDMPLDEIRTVLEAPTVEARDQAIIAHLERMQTVLEQTQATVASLKELLEGRHATLPVRYRSVGAVRAVAISDTVDWEGTEAWLGAALAEIAAVLAPNPQARAGADAALYPPEYFEAHRGEVVAFVPIIGDPPLRGRARLVEIAPAQLAVTVHEGPFADMDRSYAALGSFVAERVLGADGPIREHYLVSDAGDPSALRTEICWPVRHPF